LCILSFSPLRFRKCPCVPDANACAERTWQDYYATIYSAEIVNSLTNVLFLWLGLKGLLNCRKYGHDKVFQVAFCGYLLVGAGSFLFHATLKCKQ
jgi:hypothetical protein